MINNNNNNNNNNISEMYNELAYEFARTLIGDGKSILEDRDNNPDKTDAFHVTTANCDGVVLRVVNGKTIYPNWFLDPTVVKTTGKCTTTHYTFRKAINDVLKENIGEDHKIYVSYIIDNKKEKIFSIHFFHYRKKEPEVKIKKTTDSSWISHTTGDISNNKSSISQHNSTYKKSSNTNIKDKSKYSKKK
jgi:hypothetical protein